MPEYFEVMSSEQVELFIEAVGQDAALEVEVTAATTPAQVVEIAAHHGFTITTVDLNAPEDIVTDAELAGAAGGIGTFSVEWCATGNDRCFGTYYKC